MLYVHLNDKPLMFSHSSMKIYIKYCHLLCPWHQKKLGYKSTLGFCDSTAIKDLSKSWWHLHSGLSSYPHELFFSSLRPMSLQTVTLATYHPISPVTSRACYSIWSVDFAMSGGHVEFIREGPPRSTCQTQRPRA